VTPTPTPSLPADVSIVKSATPLETSKGGQITYTLVIGNAGPATAIAVRVADSLDPNLLFQSCTATGGSCSGPAVGTSGPVSALFGALAPTESRTVTIVARVGPGAGRTIANGASVSSDTPDPNPDNNASAAVNTLILDGGTNDVPALSPPALALFGLLLAGAGLYAVRKL
jgi:uncharacterized repeat protein (TIGR01451 family)